MCESMGVDFLTVETNFRDYYNDWEQEHFNLIVSALYFFEKYPYKITASSLCVLPVSYKMWSSNPITDLMLSCNSANVISDDVAYDRVMKANVVKNWKLATKKCACAGPGQTKAKIVANVKMYSYYVELYCVRHRYTTGNVSGKRI